MPRTYPKGVYPRASTRGMTTYYVQASVGGEHRYLGTFQSPEAAAARLQEMRQNFPPTRRPHRFGHVYRQRALFGAQVRIKGRRFFLGLHPSRARAEQALIEFARIRGQALNIGCPAEGRQAT